LGNGGIERLTDRERRLLRLLASGHSVKSAALAEVITENAANELLRSSRRKLGTGSSREAARLLAEHEGGPQKNRDEKSGVPVSPADERSRSRFNKGIVAMIVTALAASAAFMMFGTQSGNSSSHGGSPRGGSDPGGARSTAPAADAATPPPPDTRAPRVIATRPGEGAVIDPGPFQLSVTFDRQMAPESYAFSHDRAEAVPPECSGPPRLSSDGRTYTLDCSARPGDRYVTYFNRPPHIGFLDAETRAPAEPAPPPRGLRPPRAGGAAPPPTARVQGQRSGG
jgi:DNA-binding CsgD family transcriptional regulator